jgi:hypothetical protein
MGAVIGVIAASAARADADLLERFRVGDATAADRAQSLAHLGLSPARLPTRYLKAGVIRQAGADRYYLDESALAAYRRGRGPWRVVFALAAGLLALGAALIAATARSGRPSP